MSEKSISSKAYRVLFANFFVRSARLVFQIFLNVLIWKHTEDIQVVALFNMIYLSTHLFSFFLIAPIIKHKRRVGIHIGSLILYTCVYLFIIWLGQDAVSYIYLIAALIGLVNGAYRITYHNNQFDLTTYTNRGRYEGTKKSLQLISKVVVPAWVGYIISANRYGWWYERAFGLGALFFLLAASIGAVNPNVQHYSDYNIWKAFKIFRKHTAVFRSLFTYSFSGFSFSNSLLDILIPVLLFSFIGKESELGVLLSLFSMLGIISSYIFGRWVPYTKYARSLRVSWLLYAGAILTIILFPEYTYIMISSAFLNFIALFFSLPQKVISDNVLHQIPTYQEMRAEYMVVREVFLYIGWFLSFLCVYMIGSLQIASLQYLLFIMVLLVLIAAWLLSTIQLQNK